jgi:branched-chain amino acid transport system substrate-binding protein
MLRRTIFLLALTPLLGCPAQEAVKFGAVLPLTGQAEIYGRSIQKGVELAFEQISTDADYPHSVELSVVDSGSDPDKGRELLDQLFRDGAVSVIGGVTTAEALQMVAVADKFERTLISPSASSPELTGISKNFYRVFPSDSREGTKMGSFAAQKMQVEDVVILAKEDAYAKGIQEVFKAEFERQGGEVLDLIEFPEGAADFSGLIDRVMTLQPKAVYLAAYASDVALMIDELRERGYQGNIFTTAAFAAPEIIEQVGAAAESVYLTQAVFEVESEEPLIADFVKGYKEKYGLAPDLYAAHGYDTMMILAQALEEAGPIPSDFWKGMRSIREIPGVTGTIQFDEKGDAQKFPRVYVVVDGNLVDYEAVVEEERRQLLKRLQELRRQQERALLD